MVTSRGSTGHGRPVRFMGTADLHGRADRRCHERTPGHQGAMDGPAFAAHVEKVLVPELEPGTVVIPDTLATHRNAQAAKAMQDAGRRMPVPVLAAV